MGSIGPPVRVQLPARRNENIMRSSPSENANNSRVGAVREGGLLKWRKEGRTGVELGE